VVAVSYVAHLCILRLFIRSARFNVVLQFVCMQTYLMNVSLVVDDCLLRLMELNMDAACYY